MKKEFMEPEMRRIELNLKESIASASGLTPNEVASGIFLSATGSNCTTYFWETQITVPMPIWGQDFIRAIDTNWEDLTNSSDPCYKVPVSREALRQQLGL